MHATFNKLDPLEAYRQVMQFSAQRGENALRLSLHAAVPQVLRPDLLHLLRLNFVPESIDDSTVESDVLFAPFCEELGNGYFQFDKNSRLQLLTQLDPTYENDAVLRSQQVADFLLAYIERQSRNLALENDLVFSAYLDVERWVALAFFDPDDAAGQLAVAVKQASEEGAVVARMRIGGLASALATPLAKHRELLAFAAGLEAFEAGDVRKAENLLEPLGDREIQVGEVTLRSPRSVLSEMIGRPKVQVDMPEPTKKRLRAEEEQRRKTAEEGAKREAEGVLHMTASEKKRTKVFVSYSHEDALWVERLKVHMKPLVRDGLVDFWDDTKIQPGMDWRAAIREAIGSTKVAILLISADYLV
jgi:TIR domain